MLWGLVIYILLDDFVIYNIWNPEQVPSVETYLKVDRYNYIISFAISLFVSIAICYSWLKSANKKWYRIVNVIALLILVIKFIIELI